MPFLELTLTTGAAQQPRIEAALEDLGTLAITLRDADVDTPDEQAIFEPGVAEVPLWPTLVLTALFDAEAERRDLLNALVSAVPELDPTQILFANIADQDWERVWMDQFKPMCFGQRLWIYPWNIEPPVDADDAVIVRLDPGLAFGTGTHPTTALCLQWLDSLDVKGKAVIDYGCGSGVLAIAALKLGATCAIGVDNDPQALTASRNNAERNGVAERLDVYLPDAAPGTAADIFVANILAGPLTELEPRFATACKPGAPMALSGILDGQQDELLQTYASNFDNLHATVEDGWVRITGTRR